MLTINRTYGKTLGDSARKVRQSLGLTQQQLAEISGLSKESVYQFEHHLPVCLDARRRILKALWALKSSRN
jgi:transcriptional regulator with XRE-family HTH domain